MAEEHGLEMEVRANIMHSAFIFDLYFLHYRAHAFLRLLQGELSSIGVGKSKLQESKKQVAAQLKSICLCLFLTCGTS